MGKSVVARRASPKQPSHGPGKAADAPHVRVQRRFRPLLGWLGAGLAIFLGLVAWRHPIIDSPPYFDFAEGLFMEANWLADHHFDYFQLRNEQVGNDFGPRVYVTSLMPTLLALLMNSGATTRTVMIIGHLFSFACATVLLLIVFALARPTLGKLPAALVCAAIVTTPLFSVQVEMLGMDLPMAMFACVAVLLAVQRHYVWAALAAAMAFLMKNTGLIASVAIVCYLAAALVIQWRDEDRRSRWLILRGLLVNAAGVIAQAALFRWGKTSARLVDSSQPFEFVSFFNVVGICPDLVILFLICLAVTLILVARWLVRDRILDFRRDGWRGTWGRLREAWRSQSLVLWSWLMVGGTVLAIWRVVQFPVPRYFTIAVPFLYLVLGTLLFAKRPRSKWAAGVLVALIALNLVNAKGRFFPAVENLRRNGPTLERSHEYLADHQSIIRAMQMVEERCRELPILTAHPFAYYLSLPRLGYVRRPLHGYVINPFSVAAFPDVAMLFRDRPRELVVILVDNIHYALSHVTMPPPDASDPVLYQDEMASPLVVYRKDLRKVASTDQQYDDWLLTYLWFDRTVAQRMSLSLATRAKVLYSQGQAAQATALLRRAVGADPADVEARLELARLAVAAGQYDEAAMHALEALWWDRQLAEAYYLLGLARFNQRKLVRAANELAAAQRLDPGMVDARYCLGCVRLAQADFPAARALLDDVLRQEPAHIGAKLQLAALDAAQHDNVLARLRLEDVLAADAHNAQAHFQLGRLALDEGRSADALREFAEVDPRAPEYAAAQNFLGSLYAQREDLRRAATCFTAALAHQPNLAEAHNGLGLVLARQERLEPAIKHFDEALKLRADYAEARENKRQALAKLSAATQGAP